MSQKNYIVVSKENCQTRGSLVQIVRGDVKRAREIDKTHGYIPNPADRLETKKVGVLPFSNYCPYAGDFIVSLCAVLAQGATVFDKRVDAEWVAKIHRRANRNIYPRTSYRVVKVS